MPRLDKGWELHVVRRGLHRSSGRVRTYGDYQVYHDGNAVTGLSGHVCECPGPGDNKVAGNGLRIEAGRYPVWTQFGRYRSTGYSLDTTTPGLDPMPAFRLEGVNARDGILVHPGHPPKLFLSSIGCFNLTNALQPDEVMNYWDSRARVIALLDDLQRHAPTAFAHPVITRVTDAWVIVDGEPMNDLAASPAPAAAVEPDSLPISHTAARTCAEWLMRNFGDPLRAAVAGKPYGLKHLCAIVCQETAYKWLKWTGDLTPAEILAACVFDANGDYPDTNRSAFPRNTEAFRAAYGAAFTDMLIEEANKARRIQGWSDKAWVYKGYGIFQYDLQHVVKDRAFFEERQWRDFGACLDRCCGELDAKLAAVGGDLWKAIKAYNGAGARADQYAANVRVFSEWCAPITGD